MAPPTKICLVLGGEETKAGVFVKAECVEKGGHEDTSRADAGCDEGHNTEK